MARTVGAEPPERDLLIHDPVAPNLAACDPAASEARQCYFLNIFKEGELVEQAVCANYAQTAEDGIT